MFLKELVDYFLKIKRWTRYISRAWLYQKKFNSILKIAKEAFLSLNP